MKISGICVSTKKLLYILSTDKNATENVFFIDFRLHLYEKQLFWKNFVRKSIIVTICTGLFDPTIYGHLEERCLITFVRILTL